MVAKGSYINCDNKLYVDCAECNRGGNGFDVDKCACGWQVKKLDMSGCYCGILIKDYEAVKQCKCAE
jgi:hypothetical protein